MSASDEDIIRLVSAGKAEMFHIIFERYYARIEAFVRHSGIEAEACHDIIADVFVRAFESVAQFDSRRGTPYLAYLYAIAHNLVVDFQRQGHVRQDEELRESSESTDPSHSPLEQMLQRELIVRVRRAIARLPADHRQIIHLAFDDDLSARDIAQIMDKPSVTAVTSHLYRALQALRKKLEADGYFAELASKGREKRERERKSG